MPVPGGLGVHLTIDLGGQARFGPDVEWIDRIDYTVDPARADSFYAAVRRYWPDLQGRRAAAGLCRHPPEDRAAGRSVSQDFVVQGPPTHGVPGLVNLFGIESPGLTAALALADHVNGGGGERITTTSLPCSRPSAGRPGENSRHIPARARHGAMVALD